MRPWAPPMGFGSKHGHWDGTDIVHDMSPGRICDNMSFVFAFVSFYAQHLIKSVQNYRHWHWANIIDIDNIHLCAGQKLGSMTRSKANTRGYVPLLSQCSNVNELSHNIEERHMFKKSKKPHFIEQTYMYMYMYYIPIFPRDFIYIGFLRLWLT